MKLNREILDEQLLTVNLSSVRTIQSWHTNPVSKLAALIRRAYGFVLSLVRNEMPTSLGDITLGTYIRCCQTDSPTAIVGMIASDLGLECASPYVIASCYKVWSEMLEQMTKKVEETQPNVSHDSMSQAIWQQVCSHHSVPPTMWMADSLSRRFGISYDQAFGMHMADVLTALNIDAVNAEYQSRMADQQIQKAKNKR